MTDLLPYALPVAAGLLGLQPGAKMPGPSLKARTAFTAAEMTTAMMMAVIAPAAMTNENVQKTS